ncbi:MAG: hypothetical protein LLF97_03150 [Planctomycetaceae bacterium]|nr:hypothetical protein [Planctomycetaceae bacterium]
MIDPPDDRLKQYEEQKREAHWDPAKRWRSIQDMIAWADAQATVRRNTRQRCLELQREKIASLDEKSAAT